MSFSSSALKLAAVAICAAVLFTAISSGSQGSVASYVAASNAVAAFYTGGAQLPSQQPTAPPAAGPPFMDNSTFPAQEDVCSAWGDTIGSGSCSSFGPGKRCSAHCSSGGTCSTLDISNGAGQGTCSTQGERAFCSSLQPNNGNVGPTMCSILSNAPAPNQSCSVYAPARRQACSAEDGFDPTADICSVIAPSQSQCSLLNPGTTLMSFCSTGVVGDKQCSTFNGAGDCSVAPNGRGICTSFEGAPNGSCSVHDMGRCSFIGGANGNRCRRG